MAVGCGCSVAIPAVAVAPLVPRARVCATVEAQVLKTGRVHVAGSPCGKEHFNAYNDKDGRHGYQTWHGRIAVVPEMGETWVRERLKGSRQQVDKGGRNEDTCPKVPGYEEELVRHRYGGKALDDNGEGASCAYG